MPSTIPAAEWHRTMLGLEPTEQQSKLYNSYPKYRGIADPALDPKVAEAILILALSSGFAQDKVLVLAPLSHEKWVLSQVNQLVVQTFQHCKMRTLDQAKREIAAYTQLFKKLQLTGRLLQLPKEPQHWVSFGFTLQDPLPEWMRPRLLVP